jgi:hypothetical protein
VVFDVFSHRSELRPEMMESRELSQFDVFNSNFYLIQAAVCSSINTANVVKFVRKYRADSSVSRALVSSPRLARPLSASFYDKCTL